MKRFPALLLVMTFVASIDAAELKTGTFEGNSRSIRLLESSFLALGYGTVTTSFTTYDGSTSIFPLWQQLPGGFAFSAELRPRAGASGGALYDTDYATSSSSLSSWIAYGSYTITLPTTDTDANGLADWSQLNQEANVAFSGTAYQDYPTVDVRPFSGTLLRPAGAFAGNWTVLTSSGNITEGKWEVLHIAGSSSYERGTANKLQLSFRIDNPAFQPQEMFTGGTNYTIVSQNEITLPSFAIRSPSGLVQNILGPLRFLRSGNRYVANMQLFDGVGLTYWRDYIHHVVEIIDLNDADFDGVPDLSDLAHVPANVLTQTRNGGSLSITWPLAAAGFKLQSADSPLPAADWQDYQPAPIPSGGNNVVTATIGSGSQFFRLKK